MIRFLVGYLLTMAFTLIGSEGILAQSPCPKSEVKKAQSAFEDAASLFKSRKYDEAGERIEKAIDADPEFAEAYYLQGTIAAKRKDSGLMKESFEKAIELCPEGDPNAYFELGRMAYDLKEYEKAEKMLNGFLSFDKISESNAVKAELMLSRAKLYSHPVPFDPQPVKSINTADPEYLPSISPDRQLAFFTRRFEYKDKNMLFPQNVEKFMVASLQADGTYDRGVPMDPPFNMTSNNNEGGAAITIDNKHLFFTVNRKGNFDICTSDKMDGRWGDLKEVSSVNHPVQWDSQPSISSDGKTLYFASARDSLTGIDIYVSRRKEDGNWSTPQKLPSTINTSGNDKSPFIHPDNKTLYFASDSLPGLGGYDLFIVRMGEDGKWGKPVNLGYPINTSSDEVGFFVSTDGKRGYFASNKFSANSGYDIYSFELYEGARPKKVYFQKGELKNGQDEVMPATIEVRDVVTNELTRIEVDSTTGEYAFVVGMEHDLMLSVKKQGFAFESQYLSSLDTSNLVPRKLDIRLNQLEVGGQYTINDILFASNSFELNDTIKVVLDEFSDYLSLNPGLKLALHGHTDDVGSPTDNMVLSQNRAKAVNDYLVSRGVDKGRLTYQGFGESRPIASNATEEGRAKNRRTVFVVNQK